LRTTPAAIVLAMAGVLTASNAAAVDYFPATPVELQQALDDAAASPVSDVVHLLASPYATTGNGGRFVYASNNSGAMEIVGVSAGSSLLDGSGVHQVLEVATPGDFTLRRVGLVNGAIVSAGPGQVKGAAAHFFILAPGCAPLTLTLEDVTVANTHAVGNGAGILGGVMYIEQTCGDVVLTNVTFNGNSATQTGSGSVLGGILRSGNVSDSPLTTTITNLVFTGNASTSSGGGGVLGGLADLNSETIAVDGLSVSGQTVTVDDVGPTDSSGGIVSVFGGAGDLTLRNVSILGATVRMSGGATGSDQVEGGILGVHFSTANNVTIDRLRLEGNVFEDTGNETIEGGMLFVERYGQQANPAARVALSQSKVLGNRSTSVNQSLGLVHVQAVAEVTIVNNAIGNNHVTVNSATDNLGTLLAGGEPLRLLHNTIWNNVLDGATATTQGGGFFFGNGGSEIDLYSNIIWGNSAAVGADVRLFSSAPVDVRSSHNDIGQLSSQGVTFVVDVGNISADPMLAAGGTDYHLLVGSPALDAGDPAPPFGLPATDLDGDPRVIGPAPDIGADEAVGGGIAPGEPNVPTLSGWAMLALAGALAAAGARSLRR
jgi:IPTL-CTERM motif